MSIFKRIQKIISANISELLDEVEDPETTIRQMIRDMERGISEMRKHTASVIGSQKMAEKKLRKALEEERHWLENAEAAVKAGKDDLAMRALQKKKTAEEKISTLHRQIEDETALVGRLKEELAHLEDKIQEVRIKRDTLVAKKRAVATQQKLMESGETLSGSAGKIINGFDQFENETEKLSADVEAKKELEEMLKDEKIEETFSQMKMEKDLDDELEDLKKKLGG
ncbi:PspA/IM30 family protein [Thermodesulfobacteriota bacterium]